MRVDELIRLLQRFPGDYTVGQFSASLTKVDAAQFRFLDSSVGVNNTKRRVYLGFGDKRAPASTQELRDSSEVSL